MLSRRNIRIKVMQLLYAKSRDSAAVSLSYLLGNYQTYGKRTLELYLYSLAQLVEVCKYAVTDDINRRAKYVPTEEDKQFLPKLYHNPLIEGLVLRGGRFDKATKKYATFARLDADTSRLFYHKFQETVQYQNYLRTESTEVEHRQVLLDLYKFLMQNETFVENLEDLSASWYDDETLIVGIMKKTLKALPHDAEIVDEFVGEDILTLQFGEQLLVKTYNKETTLLDDIKPMLQNWDSERVATIDMILLKMALCELLEFPTIPTKVTINEYVDISKEYSTDRSREFVNGILDRLMKHLKENGRIVKEGRGLVE